MEIRTPLEKHPCHAGPGDGHRAPRDSTATSRIPELGPVRTTKSLDQVGQAAVRHETEVVQPGRHQSRTQGHKELHEETPSPTTAAPALPSAHTSGCMVVAGKDSGGWGFPPWEGLQMVPLVIRCVERDPKLKHIQPHAQRQRTPY